MSLALNNWALSTNHSCSRRYSKIFLLYVLEKIRLEIRVRFCVGETGLKPPINFSTVSSKIVPLLQYFFVHSSVVSYMMLVLSLYA